MLIKDNPTLYNQIIFEKHPEINFNELTIGSSRKIWWQCDKNHEWQTTIEKRYKRNYGCPYCSGKKVCLDNCLATINPEITSQWNYDRNTLTPQDLTAKSGKKVWWKCNKKHEWYVSPEERIRGRNCPYCSGARVCNDNCLINKRPELCKEWNYDKNINITPYEVTEFSTKKVWWKCKKKHEWQAIISNRSSGAGCKRCNNPNISKIEKKFYNLFKIVFPDAENSHHFYLNNKQIEIDIYLRNLNIGIEIDGGYVHNKIHIIKRDINKNNLIEAAGIYLIRLREENLPIIQKNEFNYIHRKFDSVKNAVINTVNLINNNFNLSCDINNLVNFTEKDYKLIYD